MRTVLIIGGSRGIGAHTVRAFCRDGWKTAFTYCESEDAAHALTAETGAAAYRCDVRSEVDVLSMAAQASKRLPHLDAMIYCAGTAWTGLLQDMTAAEWDDLFAVHVRGAFLTTRAFLPGMISRKAAASCTFPPCGARWARPARRPIPPAKRR